MADVFSRRKRSEIMSRIRNRGTLIEDTLYDLVRQALGPRRRVDRNVRDLPGRPDVMVPSLRLAIFADGCFYHCCPKHGHIPKNNKEYWGVKLAGNSTRDKANRRRLRKLGFSVWTIWEHALEGTRIQRTRVLLEGRLDRAIKLRNLPGR